MKSQGSVRQRLEAAVMERHCANHPLTEKWVGGQISRNAMMGWAIEHWHWVNKMPEAAFSICAKAPKDVIAMELEDLREETDEARSHRDIVLRFAQANGAISMRLRRSGIANHGSMGRLAYPGGERTSSIKGVAALRIGTDRNRLSFTGVCCHPCEISIASKRKH